MYNNRRIIILCGNIKGFLGMPAKTYFQENISRLAALHGLEALDSGTEKVYDEITQLTADLCEAPVCLVSLVDEDRQWFKSEIGLGISETKIEQSICAHAVRQDSYLEIHDTHHDSRTVGNSLCQGNKPFRFYAGAILRTLEGWPLGTLCVLDYEPRHLTELQRRVLEVHAKAVTRHLELTKSLVQKVEQDENTQKQARASKEDLKQQEHTRALFDTLTPREKEVLNLIAGQTSSLSSKEIAKELDISFRTVHHHRAHIMAKMDVDSVAQLIAVSLKAKILL